MDISLFLIELLMALNIQGEYLAYNDKLYWTAVYRQNYPVEVALDKRIDLSKYQCLVGVPHGFKNFIGHEVIFVSEDGAKSKRWLIVDVQQEKHAGYMERNNLLADVDCKEFVHKRGALYLVKGKYHAEETQRRGR